MTNPALTRFFPFFVASAVAGACSCGSSSGTGTGGASSATGTSTSTSTSGPGSTSTSASGSTSSGSSSSTGSSSSSGGMDLPCVAKASWTSLNAGIVNVKGIAVSKTTGEIYASSYGNGVYHSSDNGKTWDNTNAGLGPNHQFAGIGVREATGTVVACTFDDKNAYGGFEVYRSTDHAKTWAKSMTGINFMGTLCFHVGVDEANNRFVAGVGWEKTIYISTDDGQSWTEKDKGWPADTISIGLLIDPKGRIWSGTENFLIWRSSDGGATWENLTKGLVPPKNNVHQIAMDSLGNVFASRSAGDSVQGVSKSTDDGASFTTVGLDNEPIEGLAVGHNDVVYAGGAKGTADGVYVSPDHGATWTLESDGLTDLNIRSMAVGPDGAIYAGTTAGGLFRTSPVCAK